MNIWKTLISALVVIALGALVFVLARGSDLPEPERQSYETVIGEFKSLGGIRVNKSITHLLEDEHGTIYYTFSDRYDLSDARYMDGQWEVYGLLMHYSNLDKDVLEVRRLSVAPAHEEETETVEMLHFESPAWGMRFDYPSNWTLTEGTASILITANEDNGSTIQIQKTPKALAQGPDQENSMRIDELKVYAASQTALSTLESSENFVGPDQLLSLKLQDPSGSAVTYLLPRFPELLRLDFTPGTVEPGLILSESNVFARLLTTLRFFPVTPGATSADSTTTPIPALPTTSDASSSSLPESASTPAVTSTTSSVTQVEFSKYASLESSTFGFKMNYPAPWYFQGDNGVYSFSDQDLEKNPQAAIFTMRLRSADAVGIVTHGNEVSLTVEKAGQRYTFKGPLEYQKVMQTMADSIVKL